ncbi:hypothetical protein JCM10908_003531 [Rhodotorula pacifica]|uniref:uncharacterized protein n=1 Tax=Rhodotorula pacifica TaxID=1495444 RepID=UPI00316CBCE4
MLSLDMRMIGVHSQHANDSLAHLGGGAAGYSPITPVNLKQQVYDYEATILAATTSIANSASSEQYDDLRASFSWSEADSCGHLGSYELPELSVGDSCSDAHSPATSWADDSLARTSPDPPALDLVAQDWLHLASAAPPLAHLDRARSQTSIFDLGPKSSITATMHAPPANQADLNALGAGLFPYDAYPPAAPVTAYQQHTVNGDRDFQQVMHRSPQSHDMGVPGLSSSSYGFAPVSTETFVEGRASSRTSAGPPTSTAYDTSSASSRTTAGRTDYSQHHMYAQSASYSYQGQPVAQSGQGHSQVLHLHGAAPIYTAQPHQHEQQYVQSQQQQQQPYPNAGVAQGYLPVQFTTVTGATYAVAIPISATQQTAAIETPHGTYYFVPSPPAAAPVQSQNPSPSLNAHPPQLPLGVMPTPPTVEMSLPTPPERSITSPPITLAPLAQVQAKKKETGPRPRPAAKARSAKSRAADAPNDSDRSRKSSEASPLAAEQERVEPAKSSTFQIPQGPSAAAIAAENAAKAAARVAALDPAHKIRLPVGQGKRGSTKRKSGGSSSGGGSSKKDSSRRFTCPHPGCGRGFARNFNMQSHYKSHLGIREYDCLWCTKKFSRRHDRARHCVTVHEAVVDRDGTITGPHPVMEKNKGKTSIKLEDDAMNFDGDDDDDDIDAEGDYDLDHPSHHHDHTTDREFARSPEERDLAERRLSASASPHVG